MSAPVRYVGDSTAVQSRVVSTGACRLIGLVGLNTSGTDVYIQIFALNAVPAGGSTPVFSFLATAGLPYSFALPAQVDLDACSVAASTTANTYTAAAGNPVTIQALLAS